jgi:3-isopropylmalate dehydrogenase
MAKTKNILLLAGDGIGPEIMEQAKLILQWFESKRSVSFKCEEDLIGGCAIDAVGIPISKKTLEKARHADAVLMGAVGGPKWDKVDFAIRPEAGLLQIRKHLGLFANLRPAIVFDELADTSTLKKEVVLGLDILIVRELTGDIYFGKPAYIKVLHNGTKRGVNTLVYTTLEVEKIARVAFDLARKRNKRLCSIDKANVLIATKMWREVVTDVHRDYPDVELTHMYVDNAAMQLVRKPKQFDVIVTTNMFGDILSDCAAMLTGSIGMLPSASLGILNEGGKRHALYEPAHGSAPDIAGHGIANPLAMILSLAMMFKYSFDMPKESKMIEFAVKEVLRDGVRTADIMQAGKKQISTQQMGKYILEKLARGNYE